MNNSTTQCFPLKRQYNNTIQNTTAFSIFNSFSICHVVFRKISLYPPHYPCEKWLTTDNKTTLSKTKNKPPFTIFPAEKQCMYIVS